MGAARREGPEGRKGDRPVSRPRILLTGATGFIGSRVLRTLLGEGTADGPAASVRALGRTVPSGAPDVPGLSWTRADLGDPSSLRGAARGQDVLVHLASRITGSEAECAAVNVRGTAALVEEAREAGVRRIVHLSTAAVYGPGPHRGIGVGETEPAPVSAASVTRLAGEEPALAAGGVVLRPNLVLGAGDRWVVPALAELLERVPARWDGGAALVSMVDAGDLARLVTALACSPGEPPAGVYHAGHPRPVRLRDLMDRLASLGVLPGVFEDLPWEDCLRRLRETPGTVDERRFALLGLDHWYRSDEVWRVAGCPAGPGPLARLEEAAPWYRGLLAGRRADRDGR
ncbi:Nucleoside-diphosphate-sugar epimerase [Streptomyces pini]|uniref:Nucleoside-diphosphate-sugar epimerase n=1 Tax=Streptomyces pini TaxID=1520580 RepID=A0A1I4IDN0_9ACTN|nr:Nucleoside-diphosphate-sugar epimerase [Streptomyces pini]